VQSFSDQCDNGEREDEDYDREMEEEERGEEDE
jgi:hypothetical protein